MMRGTIGIATVAALAIAATTALAQGTGDTSGHDPGAGGATGEAVYREVCQACHMPAGEGGTGAAAIPALAKNAKLADADWMVSTIVKGRGGMPTFNGMLSPDQIASVATYVRGHFGNAYAKPVTVDDVKRLTPEGEE
ncbi:c-type cytochrome [Sphingomonas montanisoli]|uniref:Cytochrome c n=1 Tax=Sphingomonas montanisoli TaxID=2606412 RepID=A0A5D9CG77_9SPHN|nr:cytochrome c [Sphingomonas montanisoli]TZG29065.1 cytochrome c [Sphingomonas montanisoli]